MTIIWPELKFDKIHSQVVEFISCIPGCDVTDAEIFEIEEIDGTALLLIQQKHLRQIGLNLQSGTLVKLLRKSINGHYRFERILGKILSSLDTDNTENDL